MTKTDIDSRIVRFSVPDQPRALIRAKPVQRRGYVKMIDPPDNKIQKEKVAWCALEAMRGRQPFEGPVFPMLTFYLKPPKQARHLFPASKPDLDNLEKLIKDAMNGVVYVDDAQVCEVHKVKLWAYGRDPGTEVTVRSMEHEEDLNRVMESLK